MSEVPARRPGRGPGTGEVSRAVRSPTVRAVRSLATHLPDRFMPPTHPDFDTARSVYFTGVVALDLSGLTEVTVDSKTRIARAAGGATTGAYTAAAGRYGLATGFGDSPKVGIGGITQCGGIGFLHRRFGLTVDALLGAQVVTAAGEILEVDGERRAGCSWPPPTPAPSAGFSS